MGEEAPKIVPEEAIRPPKEKPGLKVVEGPVEPVVGAEAKEPPKRGRFPLWGKILTSLGIASMVGGGIEAADQQGVLPEPIEKPYDAGKKVVQEVGQEFAQGAVRVLEKAGVDIIKTDEEIAAGISARANLTQKTQESPTVTQTESQEIKDVEKKIRGKINLITDEKLKEMQVTQAHRKYPQEVVYRNEVSGPEAMKEVVWYSWALILKERENDPGFKDIPDDNPEALIAKLQEKLEKGEDLSFDIWLWNNLNKDDETPSGTSHRVDLTRGTDVVFVAEAPANEFVWVSASRKGEKGEWVPNGAFGYGVSAEGALTIKIYGNVMDDRYYTWILGEALGVLITQDTHPGEYQSEMFIDSEIPFILFPGVKIENHKMIGGEPILAVRDIEK